MIYVLSVYDDLGPFCMRWFGALNISQAVFNVGLIISYGVSVIYKFYLGTDTVLF
jgi:hypothetical protein